MTRRIGIAFPAAQACLTLVISNHFVVPVAMERAALNLAAEETAGRERARKLNAIAQRFNCKKTCGHAEAVVSTSFGGLIGSAVSAPWARGGLPRNMKSAVLDTSSQH